jgi:formate hydrogenlyase subunit 3/multisubunit Na+/H+ antiporter MnhD subunit
MSELAWLIEKSPLLSSLVAAGILTAPIGALLALSEKRDARWLAYLSLVPLGHTLIGLGLGTHLALVGALVTVFSRALGVALVAGGLTFAQMRPLRKWRRLGALSILVGGFSLAGIPPTLGSAAQLAIYHDLASNVGVIALMFSSSAAALLATIRVAWQLIVRSSDEDAQNSESRWVTGICAAVLLLLGFSEILLGIFPQVIADPFLAAMGSAAYLK